LPQVQLDKAMLEALVQYMVLVVAVALVQWAEMEQLIMAVRVVQVLQTALAARL
jgi:hypothetical protein